MTPEQLDKIDGRHSVSDHGNYCSGCSDDWPCTEVVLVAEVRRLRDALAVTAQLAADNAAEMIRAQSRAERAEAEADEARQAALNLAGHVTSCEHCPERLLHAGR